MTLVRVIATLSLLAVGWALRRRPLLGPLVLIFVGAALTRLWQDTGHHAVARRGYRTLTTGTPRNRR